MTTKTAIPQTLPLPQELAVNEMDDRALQLAGMALIERLNATEGDTGEVGVQALTWNLQNLMRLFDRTSLSCKIRDGTMTFKRTVEGGDWEQGPWTLSWRIEHDEQ